MYQHMILMCSDFSQGDRIALYRSYSDIIETMGFRSLISEVKEKYPNISFSFHHIETSSESIYSVADYDDYFKDVEFYYDSREFEVRIDNSKKVTPEDVVKYILTLGEYSQLQIQKLLYFICLEYAKHYDKALFKEHFEVWEYGPVIRTVYNEISYHEARKIALQDTQLEKVKLKLRLLELDDADKIVECIEAAIKQYGKRTARELVDITHLPGTPWKVTKEKKGLNSKIPWKMIRDYARGNQLEDLSYV